MFIQQLSVFLENREGRLEEVTETVSNIGVNIVSFSLADTSEYGMLRMIVSDPVKAKAALKEAGFSAMLTDVIAIKLPSKVGMLHELLKTLSNEDINLEYMYTLATGENASIVLKVSDTKKGIHALQACGFAFFDKEAAYAINQ